jgi:tetratricopeptide (TPR) repeat protein
MSKRVFPQLLALFLFVFASTQAQDSLPELVRRVKPSVVSILTFNAKNESLMSGTGFFLRPGQVVTNLHVIAGADHAEIRTLDGKGKSLTVNGLLKSDEEGDLALLSVTDPSDRVRTVEMAGTTPDEGEKIFVIGNPLRMEGSISDGIVAAVREVPTLGNVVQITAPISHGSSGSPVFNMKGQVIGLVSVKVTNGQNLNLALGVSRLNSLLPGPLVKLDRAEDRPKVQAKDEALAEWWYKSGLSSLWLGNYDSALGYFRGALERNPARVEAWIEVGFCMVKQGKNDEAIKALQRAIQLRPGSFEAWNKLGDAYYYATRYSEAIDAYTEAARIRPEMAEAHYNLGVTYMELGDREAALAQSKLLEGLDSELNKKLLNEIGR